MTKDKIYYILNEKLFEIAEMVRLINYERDKNIHQELWETYLKEMGITVFVRSGWFRENDMEDDLGTLSFTNLKGQKVDVEWIEENLTIIPDPFRQFHKVGVPKELAMKALVLGQFPDSPSISKIRESLKTFCRIQN